MGWKLVRDNNEAWCRARGFTGQWRIAPDPESALFRKIFEEAGEYAEHRDPAELYDLRDVVTELIRLVDPDGAAGRMNLHKTADMGGFGRHVEWTPAPPGIPDYEVEKREALG